MALAADQEVVPPWPANSLTADATAQKEVITEDAAHEHRVTNINNPTLTAFLPAKDKATGVAVVIAPGGGPRFLSIDHEGYDVGKWLAGIGVAGFVLKYRLARAENSPFTIEDAYQDGQRAIRLIRSRAHEWGINPAKVGILGFSAGGEGAVLAATKFDRGNENAQDPISRQSSRPDFQILIYPGVKAENINITKDTPPSFMLCANNDMGPSNAIAGLYPALKKAGVPVEIHIYNSGGHGFGIRNRPIPIRPGLPACRIGWWTQASCPSVELTRATLLFLLFLITSQGADFVLIKGDVLRPGVRLDDFEILDHPLTNAECKYFVDSAHYAPPVYWDKGRSPAGTENW